MSHEEAKFKHSKRLLKDQNAIQKQVKIAKSHGMPVDNPHMFSKHHALDCGQPNCVLCASPRRIWKEETIQEKRAKQNAEE